MLSSYSGVYLAEVIFKTESWKKLSNKEIKERSKQKKNYDVNNNNDGNTWHTIHDCMLFGIYAKWAQK